MPGKPKTFQGAYGTWPETIGEQAVWEPIWEPIALKSDDGTGLSSLPGTWAEIVDKQVIWEQGTLN